MKNTDSFLPTYEGCMVCGQKQKNPNTLNLRFRVTDEGVEVPFTPQAQQEGYRDIVHGGIICSLLDETIGWAVAVSRKKYFVTGELNVRFVRSLRVGTPVIVRGRAVEHKSRYSVAEGEIVDKEGTVYAKASGKFFLMTDQEARKVDTYLTYLPDDLHLLPQE